MKKYLVEFVGTFFLVLTIGNVVLAPNDAGALAPLAIGAVLMAMVFAGGHVSGGHYNPAVTIALFIGGKIGALKGAAYIIVQLLGATVAALVLNEIFDNSVADLAGAIPAVDYAGDQDGIIVGRTNAFILEAITTFFLVYVICGTAVDSRGAHAIAALAIGLTITMDILIAGPLTGAAMNPSRHFGPALVEGEWKDTWIYWAGPVIGGSLASIVHNYIFIPRAVGFPEAMPGEHHA